MRNHQLYLTRIGPVRIVIVFVALAAVFYVAAQFTDLNSILALLLDSSWIWIGVAVIAMLLSFVLSAVIQYVAGDNTGRILDLLKLEFAGSFFNHFLPFSVGGIGLIAEYYHKKGQRKSQSIVTAIAPIAVGAITTIIIALIISPLTLANLIHQYDHLLSSRLVQSIILLIGALGLLLIMLFKDKVMDGIREAMRGVRGLHGFQQMIKVAIGSMLMTIVAAFVLYASIHAIRADAAYIVILVIFIATLLVSELAPTPGGLGATEAVLILGLTGAGLDAEQAIAATLIFRFTTFLLPMIPGAIALSRLDHLLGFSWRYVR